MEMVESKPFLQEVDYDQGTFQWYSIFMFYVFVAAFCYLFLMGDDMKEQRLWACLVVFLGAFPLMKYFWNENLNRIPFFPLFALYHAIAFGVPGFIRGIGDIPPDLILPALKATVWALLSLMAGYYWLGPMVFPRISGFHLRFRPTWEFFLPYAWFFGMFNMILSYFPRPWSFLGPLQQALPTVGNTCYVILLVNLVRAKDLKDKGNKFFAFAVLPWTILQAFSSGALANLMFIAAMIGIVWLNNRKTIPLFTLAVVTLIISSIQPVKADFRTVTWSPAGARMSPFDKAQLLVNLVVDHYTHPGLVQTHENPAALDRMAQTSLLAVVINKTPAFVPFQDGSTLLPLFTKWIPRQLWPGKPAENVGNPVGHWYNLINADDFQTAVNLPWLIEMYIDFGWAGLTVGMAVIGLFLYFFAGKLCDENHTFLEYGISVSLVYNLWWAENNISLMLGGVMISLVTILSCLWIFGRVKPEMLESSG